MLIFSEGIVHLLLGNNTAHVIATATANQLALTMRLNEESVGPILLSLRPMTMLIVQSYEGVDPIESEMRRRIYWASRPRDSGISSDQSAFVSSRQEHSLSGAWVFTGSSCCD